MVSRDSSHDAGGSPAVGAPERRIGVGGVPGDGGRASVRGDREGGAAGARARQGGSPVAIIVCHGMGQQVPFETLNSVATALWAGQSGEPLAASDAHVRYVAFGEDWLPRVEITLDVGGDAGRRGVGSDAKAGTRGENGERERTALRRDVHLYEVYWAPFTEGKVTLRDVIGFLIGAGLRGIRYCARGSFDRWMFGALASHTLRRRGILQLGAALVFLCALIIAFAALALVCAAELVRILHPGALPAVPSWLDGVPAPAVLAAIAVGAIAFAGFRWFLVQSVGDVVAYVSAHRASRFTEIRRAIQTEARKVARNVYASRVADSGELEYDDVIIVGHSLGSVVAYDMLNDSINGDLLARENGGEVLDVVARTRLLLTLGSPLDKTAFIFRTQKDDAPLREALAAAAQPMIVSYDNRPRRWVNIWSRFDWVSGSLEYYDPPASEKRAPSLDTSTVDVSAPVPAGDTSAVDVSGSEAASDTPRATDADARAAHAAGGDRSVTTPRPGMVENITERGVPFDPVRAHLGYWKRAELARCVLDVLRGCSPHPVSGEHAHLPVSPPQRSRARK